MTWVPEDLTAQIDGLVDTFSTTFERNLGNLIVTYIDVLDGSTNNIPNTEFIELNSIQFKLQFAPQPGDRLSVEYDTDEILSGRVVGLPDPPTGIPPPALPPTTIPPSIEVILTDQEARIAALEAAPGVPGPPGPSGGAWTTEPPQIATIGQVAFTIPGVPRGPSAVAVSLNGADLGSGLQFTVAGSVVTLDPAQNPPIENGDQIVIKWQA